MTAFTGPAQGPPGDQTTFLPLRPCGDPLSVLISDSYRALNAQLHRTHRYGERGDKWADKVSALIEIYQPATILDYGCGKGALKRALADKTGAAFHEYDPAIPDKSAQPHPADLVVCTDVLEHIEPECLNDVVQHLKQLTRMALFAVVSTRPAAKTPADGRNAHLIVQPAEDWRPVLTSGMKVLEWKQRADEFYVLLSPA